MKVLHIITGLSTGGAEQALFNLLHGGLIAHFDNHVISLVDLGTMGSKVNALGVPVTALKIDSGMSIILGLARLRRVILDLQPDLIQGWMYHGNLAATLARTFTHPPPPLIWSIRHSLYSLKPEKFTTRQIIRANRYFSSKPDALLYNSHLSKNQHERFGFSFDRGEVIQNGIDVQRFNASSEARNRIRSELDIPTTALVVGHVARLHPIKNHPAFLRAAANLALRYSEIQFLLCGRNVSLESKAIAQLVPIQIRDRFHFLGERSDVFDLMNAMDIFCQSSNSEAFPNALGEAMASSVPCVATNVGDSAMIVGDTGVVVPSGDVDALATGIESLLTMPINHRRMLGDRARTRIASNFTLDKIVQEYTSLYKKLLRG